MWFLIPSLLLVAVVWHPWTHIDVPGEDAHAQTLEAAFDPNVGAREEITELRALKATASRVRALERVEAQRAQAAAEQAAAAAEAAAVEQARALEAVAAPQPQAVPFVYTGDLEDLICSYSWPCAEALAVAFCESTMRPAVTNGTSYGLFQINGIHAGRFPDFWTAWTDPVTNTGWAYQIWSAQGWYPWSCRPY